MSARNEITRSKISGSVLFRTLSISSLRVIKFIVLRSSDFYASEEVTSLTACTGSMVMPTPIVDVRETPFT